MLFKVGFPSGDRIRWSVRRDVFDLLANDPLFNFIGGQKEWISAEFCGGPHVSNTHDLGEGGKRFKIQEQENVGAGIKRIKAALV